jgi:two-component system CheB/CheR fusion protein
VSREGKMAKGNVGRNQKVTKSGQVHLARALVDRGVPNDFPIVGIGASAGGLEAFTSFLSKVPGDSRTAFILIQHLDPSQPSRLTELLSRASPIPVHEVTEGKGLSRIM